MRTLSLPAGFALLACLSPGPAQEVASRPNLLILYADDLGYGELGCYGSKEVPTPNIDSIAAHGIRFTQGYVSAPLCSPSRAGLMTGRCGTRFGHENNTMGEDRGLPLSEVTLADRLKALGYATGIVGKWHLGKEPAYLPTRRGFEDYYGVLGNPGSYFRPRGFIDARVSPDPQPVRGEGFYTTDAFATRAAEWIEEHRERPWFLYLPFNAVHTPHEAPERYLRRFERIGDPRRRAFAALLSALDDAVGKVLEKIRALDLERNTLVFFISDNGAPPHREGANGPLRGGKHTTWEGGIRVPFLVQWRGRLPEGRTEDRPVSQIDVLPTFVAAAGGAVDPAWNLDGANLLPFLTGENPGRPHETLCWRIDGAWAVRHGDFKLVMGRGGEGEPELFDLAKDPGEARDLAAVQPERVKELKSLWEAWNARQAEPDDPKAQKRKREGRRQTGL